MPYVKITSDPSPEDGINIGDVFLAKSYWLDPSEKFTLIKKVEGSKDSYEEESMNHYKENCEVLRNYKSL